MMPPFFEHTPLAAWVALYLSCGSALLVSSAISSRRTRRLKHSSPAPQVVAL